MCAAPNLKEQVVAFTRDASQEALLHGKGPIVLVSMDAVLKFRGQERTAFCTTVKEIANGNATIVLCSNMSPQEMGILGMVYDQLDETIFIDLIEKHGLSTSAQFWNYKTHPATFFGLKSSESSNIQARRIIAVLYDSSAEESPSLHLQDAVRIDVNSPEFTALLEQDAFDQALPVAAVA